MARNSVQFQKGLSDAEFEQHYGTEAACREALFRWRWPEGFECPVCGERRHSEVRSRQLFQCSACRRQTSLTAGTIFAATKVPLRTWFRAIHHVTQTKQGISSIELGRRLGRHPDHSMDHQAQARAGDAGARRRATAHGPH